ncbi:MAG: hypothetical protein E7031_08425 [Akkermansiaceae bacterium]|nr:hypothetical protein [Akkermansiaceae bacterium]
MKMRYLTVLAVLGLCCCVQQRMPAWESLPGENCTLATYRLMPAKPAPADAVPGKKVALRESEKEHMRTYLREFTEQGQISLATYAPRTVLYGDYFTLNFHPDLVILNIGKEDRTQYVRPISQQDQDLLKLLRKRSDSRALKN